MLLKKHFWITFSSRTNRYALKTEAIVNLSTLLHHNHRTFTLHKLSNAYRFELSYFSQAPRFSRAECYHKVNKWPAWTSGTLSTSAVNLTTSLQLFKKISLCILSCPIIKSHVGASKTSPWVTDGKVKFFWPIFHFSIIFLFLNLSY